MKSGMLEIGLPKNNATVILHPPFSAGLAPCYFFFQNSSWYWREKDLMTSSWFKNNHGLHLLSSKFRTCANVSNNDANTGLLYQVVRELLQRVQHGIEGKCCYVWEKKTVWKFFIRPYNF